MKVSEAFPSKYLKAADLAGRPITVIMAQVETETIGDDDRPVLYFKGKNKGLVLNKTNAGKISDAYGDDTDDWFGRAIEIYPTEVDFQGKTVEAIRCRVPKAAKENAAKAQRPASPPQEERENPAPADLDDEIPW
jgi:hypothetical protein